MKRSLTLLMVAAFVFRFGLGALAFFALPQLGYDSKPQQAGYLFFDAYHRDTQAWELAQSAKPLSLAFSDKFASDQYGGLLWISALIYRYAFPFSHQPLLIVFLAALVAAAGIPFVYLSARRIGSGADNARTAMLTALIYAFFPEGILLGASQMREPFLMTFMAMAFYGLLAWQSDQKKSTWGWVAAALAGMFLISPGFVILTVIGGAGWLFFAGSQRTKPLAQITWPAVIAAAMILLLAALAIASSWDSLVTAKGSGFLGVIGNWARGTARWNSYLLERSSGIVQVLFQSLPAFLAYPFVMAYGILQPVLPAVLFEPGNPFWQVIGTLRALGWYLLLPLITFSPIHSLLSPQPTGGSQTSRAQWLWLAALTWLWIVIAALRGGGDQWDNPRYRVIILGWIAILAANAIQSLLALRKSQPGSPLTRWFLKICLVEGIVLLVFGHWYSFRYLGLGYNIGIKNTLLLAIGLSTLLLLGDWAYQRYKYHRF